MNALKKLLDEVEEQLPNDCGNLEFSFKRVNNVIEDKKIKRPMKALNKEDELHVLLQTEKQKHENSDVEIEFSLIQEYLQSLKNLINLK